MRHNLTIMQNFLTVLIGVILAPIIYTTVTAANVDGTTATILALVPVTFSLSVVFASVKGLV